MTTRLLVHLLLATLAVVALATPGSARSDVREALIGMDGSVVIAAQRLAALETPATLGAGAHMVIFGDSLGGDIAAGLIPEAARRGAQVVPYTQAGCSNITGLATFESGTVIPWMSGCLDYLLSTWRSSVAATPADAVLWLSSFDASTRLIDGVLADPATPEGRQRIAATIRETADVVAPPGSGRRIVFLLPSAFPPGAQGGVDATSVIDVQRHRAIMHLVVSADPERFSMLLLDRFLCPAGPPCPLEPAPGIVPRPADGGHVNPEGAAWLAPQILDALGVT
ncbi:MAG: SGNH hydrolase domain-containing protein [Acidimicrobiia bacterium]